MSSEFNQIEHLRRIAKMAVDMPAPHKHAEGDDNLCVCMLFKFMHARGANSVKILNSKVIKRQDFQDLVHLNNLLIELHRTWELTYGARIYMKQG